MSSSQCHNWWSDLTDECPITLEPLSDLPYPPFILYSSNVNPYGRPPMMAKTGSQYFFDGLALATYVISQGNFVNPLTRKSLSHQDCVRLDEYLNEHIYDKKETYQQLEPTIFEREKISVREAYALRNSIKVKVGSGNTGNAEEIRRAEVLRNEAAVALRGLFVFGHNIHSALHEAATTRSDSQQQQVTISANGFDLNSSVDLQQHSHGMSSVVEQVGLRIIDDNEAAYESVARADWRVMQDAFPYLPRSNNTVTAVNTQPSQQGGGPSQILEVARRTAELTLEEERELAERQARNRHLHFMQALERKKQRIIAKKQAKADAARRLSNEQKVKDELEMARNEIDRWRECQWKKWEKDNSNLTQTRRKQYSNTVKPTPPIVEPSGDSITESEHKAAAEEEARVKKDAVRKKKRQRARERAREKKKEEQLAKEEKERAMNLQKKRDEGILGYGFEKFGAKFCSTKCARNGSKSA
eukprot:scaffold35338_cov64-Cyclotella_meneghiniana.AAC.3